MADEILGSVNWLDIKTVEAGQEALKKLEQYLTILGRRFVLIMDKFRDSVLQRYVTQFRNEIIAIIDLFKVDSLADFHKASAIFGQELAGSLYQARLGFEGLKTGIAQAAVPLVQLFVPVVQTAIAFLTELALVARRVINFLITGTDKLEDYAGAANSASSSSQALKKSLAGFDQITRLNGKNGAIGGLSGFLDTTGSWKSIVAKMKELFTPLQDLDFSAAAASLERLRKAAEPLKEDLFGGLEWAWNNLFVPLASWTVNQLLPAFLDMLTAALQALSYVIDELRPDFVWLWEECLQPWAQWKGGQIIADLEGIVAKLNQVSDWLGLNQGPVDDFIDSVRNIIQAVGELAQEQVALSGESENTASAMTILKDSVVNMFNPFRDAEGLLWLITSSVKALGAAFDDVTSSADGAWGAMDHLSTNGWGNLKNNFIDPVSSGVRQSANRMIDVVNGLLRGSVTGINFLGAAINSLSFTVPNWVPGIGGKGFSFSVKTITPPQIPYLARGAVLPANKPFMAVVGDQRHGTNIEAPLTVIQEAVANVMEDYSAANMAGHEATVSVLRELLEAVLGISIGDDVIAGAVSRYQGKMAVVRGGSYA